MKLEHPQYKVNLKEDLIVVEDWKNSAFMPAAVRELSDNFSAKFLFPVKLLKQSKDWQWLHLRTLVAVRTDVYPLLWVYIWFCLQAEWMMYHPWCSFMHFANRIGIAKTPRGNYFSWKDFLP